jgi:hypothetical protein
MPLAALELARLANETDMIVLRNTRPGYTVFQDDNTKVTLVFAGAGDPAGEDVQQCSAALLKNSRLVRAVSIGILQIEEAPEALQAALDAQRNEYESREAKMAEAADLAQRAADRTVARGIACIAPKGSRGELCGSYTLAAQNPRERPPLCAEHQHLASQYAIMETDNIDDNGKAEVVWRRASLSRARG